ncbi:hypothetical protein, partial [Streptomyces sp. NPDC058757]
YHHPELLPELEKAVDANLRRRTVRSILRDLDGNDTGRLPGLDDRILAELSVLRPAPAAPAPVPVPQHAIPTPTSGSEIG